ncbi:hypothetical protein THOM_1565 [Trachipleistophora hominis]|uniref:Uncharacterized protein n=1 Tax=Trachipleistophora hominis TaxID=72359 RepID=L7JXN7_TRAHO|nr:hypothetical protein THOM_1565 [Trachipleistophora hominis]
MYDVPPTIKEIRRAKRQKNLQKQRLIRRHVLLDIPLPPKKKTLLPKKNFLIIIRNPKFRKCKSGRRYRNYIFMDGDKRTLKDMKKNYGVNVVHYEERRRMFNGFKEIEELEDELEGYEHYICN